jgi:hypothetical protein
MLVEQIGTDEIFLLASVFALALFGFTQAIHFLISASPIAFRRMFLSAVGAAGLLGILFLSGGAN